MSTSDSQPRDNGQIGIVTLLLVIFLIFILAGGRHYFRNTGHDLRTTVQDAGADLKSSGRDVADSIRHDVQ